MKVFISWSGETSRALAEVLRQWLPAVIQAVKPYYSPDDITKGARWSSEIASTLEESRVGLICLTRENLDAPWIMFEAGALSKNLDKSKVSPILFGVEPTDLTGPLVQFQAAKFEKADLKRIVRMINGELGDSRLATDVLDNVFDMWWPTLEARVGEVFEAAGHPDKGAVRSTRDLLEEILTLTRSQARHSPGSRVSPMALADLVAGYAQLVSDARDYSMCQEFSEGLERLQRPIGFFLRSPKVGTDARVSKLESVFKQANDDLKATLDGQAAAAETDDSEDDLPF
jgi:hypothetical protein